MNAFYITHHNTFQKVGITKNRIITIKIRPFQDLYKQLYFQDPSYEMRGRKTSFILGVET